MIGRMKIQRLMLETPGKWPLEEPWFARPLRTKHLMAIAAGRNGISNATATSNPQRARLMMTNTQSIRRTWTNLLTGGARRPLRDVFSLIWPLGRGWYLGPLYASAVGRSETSARIRTNSLEIANANAMAGRGEEVAEFVVLQGLVDSDRGGLEALLFVVQKVFCGM
jgi:hypothetical protein